MNIPQRKLLINSPSNNSSLLPPEYQQVEYIVFTGTQYVDSNYTASASDKPLWVEIDFRLTSTTTNGTLIGAMSTVGYNPFYIATDTSRNAWVFSHFGAQGSGITSGVRFGTLDTDRHTIRYVFNEGIYLDGVIVPETVEQAQIISNPNCRLYIGARNQLNIRVDNYGQFELFGLKLGETSGEVRNWLGGYHKVGGTIGLYDTCNSANPTTNTPFYTNMGTGTFLKGADV